MTRNGTGVRILVVVLGTIGGLLMCSGLALAHVSVVPDAAEGGSSGAFIFRVPNEREDASTIRVEVFLPRGQPIPSITPVPIAGWNASVVTKPLGRPGQGSAEVTSIVWEGGAIGPGRSGDFAVSMGPLPQRGRLVFKALQTYSDGEVMRWIEEPETSGAEPEHPAAVLTLTSAAPGEGAVPERSDTWYVLPGGLALTVFLAFVVGVLHRRSVRRPGETAEDRQPAQVDLSRR